MNNFGSSENRSVIFITGGSRGIGAATAVLLASKGHSIVVNYVRAADEAASVVNYIVQNGGRAIAVQGDVGREQDVKDNLKAASANFGPVQAVVHCAAPNPIPQPFFDLEWETFNAQFQTQIHGAFNCAKNVLPSMVETGSGAFVFLSSVFSQGVPPTQQTAYVSMKAALAAMARSLAVEFGPKGVRFNVVSPGMTQTEMIASLPDKIKMVTRMNTPLRRIALPEDIASTIEFLLSPAARHINGENIRVCGGISM